MAALDPAIGAEPHRHEKIAAEGLDQSKPLPRSNRLPSCVWIGPFGRRCTICSSSRKLCSTSRMRIQTRALTSPSSRTGTSNSS